MRKELREINEMFTPLPHQEIDDSDVVRYQRIREIKQHFNARIEQYLKEKNISITEITKKDINLLWKSYKEQEKEILIQQIMYFLETNFGKPLKRIRENHKCALFEEIEKDGWTNWNSKESNHWDVKEWSISTTTETSWWNSQRDEGSDSSTSWELLSS